MINFILKHGDMQPIETTISFERLLTKNKTVLYLNDEKDHPDSV